MSPGPCSIAVGPSGGCLCAPLSAHLQLSISVTCDLVTERTLEIANRLRFVCAHLPPEEVLGLAARMAVVELKYASGATIQEQFANV